MRRVSAFFGLLSFVVLSASAVFAQTPAAEKDQAGVRGRIIVEPELLAATESAVDPMRVEALHTASYVRRPRGHPLQRMVATIPELSVVIEGEDLRTEAVGPKTLVFEGFRFVPGQLLLTHAGPVAIENRHTTSISVLGTTGDVLASIPPGETKQVTLNAGDQVLGIKELPYAKAGVKVLERATPLPYDINGEVPLVPLVEGEYAVSFWLGNELLHGPTPVHVPRSGLTFIDATISANHVVTVAVKDASVQVALPVAIRVPPPPPPPPDNEP